MMTTDLFPDDPDFVIPDSFWAEFLDIVESDVHPEGSAAIRALAAQVAAFYFSLCDTGMDGDHALELTERLLVDSYHALTHHGITPT